MTPEFGIDTIDPEYYTFADGDGQTTAAREASVDVGGDQRPAAQRDQVAVLSANCHRVIHRSVRALTISELREALGRRGVAPRH